MPPVLGRDGVGGVAGTVRRVTWCPAASRNTSVAAESAWKLTAQILSATPRADRTVPWAVFPPGSKAVTEVAWGATTPTWIQAVPSVATDRASVPFGRPPKAQPDPPV